MAHQTDTHVVHQNFPSDNPNQKVTDPVCGMEIYRKDSKNMVFRGENTIYFCSRKCEEKFLDPKFKPGQRAA